MNAGLDLALQKALDLVLVAQGKQWDFGDNLALVPCDDHLLRLIGVAVGHGAAKFHRLTSHSQARWGALTMIGGAQALHRAGERPRTYATIGDILHVSDLASVMAGPQRDAVEAGGEAYLGVSIIRGTAGRRFLETMLANSGIDLAVVEAAAARVTASWSWAAVADAELETVNDFVHAHRRTFDLRPGLRAFVDTEQGAFALADRLRELARFRRVVIERGLVQTTIEATRELWKVHGVDPASFLGAPATDVLLRNLLSLGRARADDYSEPRFTWVVTERYRGLAFALPRYLRASSFPAEIDEVRALVVDRDGEASGEAVRYVREGAVFRAPRLGIVPLTSARLTPPVQLVAQWEEVEGRRELIYGKYALPSFPVTMFAQDGEHAVRAQTGATVQLVLSAGWEIPGPVPALVRVAQSGLEAWCATMPSEPLVLELRGPDDERLEWTLGGEAQVRLMVRHGRRIAGLSLGGAAAFSSWPELEAEGLEGRAQIVVEEPGGYRLEARALARNGRIRFGARTAPGLYRVQATQGHRCARVRFIYLPGARFVVEHAPADAVGARASRAVVQGLLAHLTPTDAAARMVSGALEFPAEVTGTREIGVSLPDLGLTGRWSVSLHPPTARLLVDGERALPQPWDLLACNAGSILEVTGEPGAAADFEVLRRKFEIVLSSEGRRRVRLCELPGDLSEQERGVISFRWAGHRQDVEFRNQRLERPIASIGGRLVTLGSKRALEGEITAEILPVWKPWVEFERRPARLVSDTSGPHYEIELPQQAGRYFVGLTEGERPATGLCLAEVTGEPPPLETALSRMLWERDSPADPLRKALSYEPWRVLEQIAARVNRYGRRFFNVAEALREVAGRALVEILVDGAPVEESALFRLLAQYDLDLLVLRYRDLERIAPVAVADEARATELLDEVAGRGLGLVVAAVRAWPARFEPTRFGEIIAPWAPIAGGAPVQLTPDDLALIRTPDDPELLALREQSGESPRVQGLIQARKAERLLEEEPRLHDIAARFLQHEPPGPAYWDVAGTDPQRLPAATARFDAVAYACARAVHSWRRDGGDITVCRDARYIARHARALMDYWLNLLAAQDSKGAET